MNFELHFCFRFCHHKSIHYSNSIEKWRRRYNLYIDFFFFFFGNLIGNVADPSLIWILNTNLFFVLNWNNNWLMCNFISLEILFSIEQAKIELVSFLYIHALTKGCTRFSSGVFVWCMTFILFWKFLLFHVAFQSIIYPLHIWKITERYIVS